MFKFILKADLDIDPPQIYDKHEGQYADLASALAGYWQELKPLKPNPDMLIAWLMYDAEDDDKPSLAWGQVRTSPENLDATDAYLKTGKVPFAFQRQLDQERDEMERRKCWRHKHFSSFSWGYEEIDDDS